MGNIMEELLLSLYPWYTLNLLTTRVFCSTVFLLGVFHDCVSFLGSTDHLRGSSLELVYAYHTVPHILSGEAISRAIRGHMIVSG